MNLYLLLLWFHSVNAYLIGSLVKSPPLIQLDSLEGKAKFQKLVAKEDNLNLINLFRYLETQMNLGACAPASSVTVLNALDFRKPSDPTYATFTQSFAHWTQNAFIFDSCVKDILGPHVFGQTLEQFASVMSCLGLNVEYHHADASDSFEKSLLEHLRQKHIIVSNFNRAKIHETEGGHFSPLGGLVDGYMLVLDVARYKYPPVFVLFKDLIEAMASVDPQSGLSRGYCAIWKK